MPLSTPDWRAGSLWGLAAWLGGAVHATLSQGPEGDALSAVRWLRPARRSRASPRTPPGRPVEFGILSLAAWSLRQQDGILTIEGLAVILIPELSSPVSPHLPRS